MTTLPRSSPDASDELPLIAMTGAIEESSIGAGPSEEDGREVRNVVALASYDVILRIGWIFKTESVIMPAFLDLLAGPGWIRGCLLVVNRFGQSVPPAFFARRLRKMPQKKLALAAWTFAMGLPFLALAAVWHVVGNGPPAWMAGLFLVLYGIFSCCHGLNQLSYSTLQGKLVPVRLRGRLMALATFSGSAAAIVFAWWLMGDWLQRSDGGFTYIFGFTGLMFAGAAGLALFIREHADDHERRGEVVDHPLRGAWDVLREDANFRKLAVVVMFSVVGTVLFPHYQAMAREELRLTGENLMIWVIVQNAAVGMFGLLLGWVIERRGERLGLRIAVFCNALAPLAALGIASLNVDEGRRWFWVVFIPLGMTPISLKTMVGYTLEIAPEHDHPRYLSTLSLCLAVPFCFSPLVGWCVDLFGYERVFVGGAACIALAGVLTFGLIEPRHARRAPLPDSSTIV
ncbi:MAG: MFS transporter [Planctomycetia bacterium]|nr:MFS transporter [Planctomycetia bacterium]